MPPSPGMRASFGKTKTANTKHEIRNTNQIQMIKIEKPKKFRTLEILDLKF